MRKQTIEWHNNKEVPKLITYKRWNETAEYWNSGILLIKFSDELAIGTYEKAKYTDDEPSVNEYFDYVKYFSQEEGTAKADEIVEWAYLDKEQENDRRTESNS